MYKPVDNYFHPFLFFSRQIKSILLPWIAHVVRELRRGNRFYGGAGCQFPGDLLHVAHHAVVGDGHLVVRQVLEVVQLQRGAQASFFLGSLLNLQLSFLLRKIPFV